MRKVRARVLAVPVVVRARLASSGPRQLALRLLAGTTIAAGVALAVVAVTPPAPSVAVPESAPSPVSADLFTTVGTAHPLTAPFTVSFDAPMDGASVAGALAIEPETGYSLSWDAAGRVLTVSPVGHWDPDTLYRIVIGTDARSLDGGALAAPVRRVILTARAGSAAIAVDRLVDGLARLDTTFSIRVDRPVTAAAVRAALRSAPELRGDLGATADASLFTFTPSSPLVAGADYRLWLAGLVDSDGVAVTEATPLEVRTIPAPAVVRFRPKDGATGIRRDAVLSVRFDRSMERAGTASSLSVLADGRAVKGAVTLAEDGTVAVFRPADPLPYGAAVVVHVGLSARSAAGAPIAAAASATFRVEAKPAARAAGTVAIPASGGGGAVSGNWSAVERYYLGLMNCTRTGGWVTSAGDCSSPGGRDVAPLALSSGISTKVSRPYAKLLATRNLCSHFIGGNPGDRLRAAGYRSYRWAENLGCRSGSPYGAVLGSHLFFQSEKSYNGGHYVNLMNAAYDRVGIGVWVSGGRVRLVVDFYHP